MSGAWTYTADTKEVLALLYEMQLDDKRLEMLHERYVIQTQAFIFRGWKDVKPPTGALTLRVRRRGGTTTLVDNGLLRLSIVGKSPGARVGREAGSLADATPNFGVVGSNLQYAAIHQFGGTIKAKNVKNLSIPLTREARKAGSPRNFPAKLTWHPGKTANVSFLVFNESAAKRRGKRWKAAEKGKTVKRQKGQRERRKDILTFHYVLKPSVYIPPRPYLPDEGQTREIMIAVTLDYFQEIITKGGRRVA